VRNLPLRPAIPFVIASGYGQRLAADYGQILEKPYNADTLATAIAAVLSKGDRAGLLRAQLAPHHSHTGHPSIDPELMILKSFR
jgi:hypothetical protein